MLRGKIYHSGDDKKDGTGYPVSSTFKKTLEVNMEWWIATMQSSVRAPRLMVPLMKLMGFPA